LISEHAGMPRLADAVLILHAGYVSFVVFGLLLTWLGAWLGWRWVRGFWFRVLHLCAIGFVALEALIGMACPLTRLEDWLRMDEARDGFIERWLHTLLYWDLPAWVFTAAYVVFAGVVLLTFFLVPPRRRAVI
jgi:MFS family permease